MGNELDRLVAVGQLQGVSPNREQAQSLIRQAVRHLASAEAIVAIDGAGAYSLLYDAARKGLTALLALHGYRPTRTGGHRVIPIACADFATPELHPLLKSFDRMREVRNELAYPPLELLSRDPQDVTEDLSKARRIIKECTALVIT
jgi:HEPN domain